MARAVLTSAIPSVVALLNARRLQVHPPSSTGRPDLGGALRVGIQLLVLVLPESVARGLGRDLVTIPVDGRETPLLAAWPEERRDHALAVFIRAATEVAGRVRTGSRISSGRPMRRTCCRHQCEHHLFAAGWSAEHCAAVVFVVKAEPRRRQRERSCQHAASNSLKKGWAMFLAKNRLVVSFCGAALAWGAVTAAAPTSSDAVITVSEQAGQRSDTLVELPQGGLSDQALSQVRRNANARLVAGIYRPFETGDTTVYLRLLAEDVEDVPLAPGQGPGRAGFARHVVDDIYSTFPGNRFRLEAIHVAGNVVTVRGLFTGVQARTFLDVPATHRELTYRTVDVHTIDRGRIVRIDHLEDFYGAYRQMTAG